MHYNNTVVSAYKRSDSGSIAIGWYDRFSGHNYVKEILMAVDVSGIPAGSTINSVDIKVTNTNPTLPPASANTIVYVGEQDLGAWTDTGSAPVYDTFSVTHQWPKLKQVTDVNQTSWAAGTHTIPSNANMVNLWQDFVDGNKTPAHGIIIGMDTFTAVYQMGVTNVDIEVDYTAGSTTRRRVIIT
jgi:hypothetical protein